MISRFVRFQLVVFTLIAILGVGWTLVNYVKVPQLFGMGQYQISAKLGSAAGLYPNSLVTYRGVEVGHVSDIQFEGAGVVAVLKIDDGVQIPVGTQAAVHSTTAIGEQYLELDPSVATGPFLHDGDMIPTTDTHEPVPTGELLSNVDGLLRSVPNAQLVTLLDELDKGFAGTGPDLGQLLGSSQQLVSELNRHLGTTKTLIIDLGPVLQTQERSAPEIRGLSHNLASITSELRSKDAAIRQILQRGTGFSSEATSLVDELRPTVPLLLANLTSTGEILRVYLPNIEQILVIYPAFTAGLQTALLTGRQRDSAQLSARAQVNDPPACTQGFLDKQRDPRQTSPAPDRDDLYCKAPKNSPLAVRGARNIPCPNNPQLRSATPEGCGIDVDSYRPHGTDSRRPGAVPYDPRTGLFVSPQGKTFLLGAVPGPNQPDGSGEETGWLDLMMRPTRS